MATTTGPSLEVGRRAVEKLMDDTCTIARPDDKADNALDMATGQLVRRPDAPVYDGKCMVSFKSGAVDDEAGPRTESYYTIAIPLAGPPIQRGDVVTITSSRRSSDLVGRVMRIEAVYAKTMAVSRKASAVGVQ